MKIAYSLNSQPQSKNCIRYFRAQRWILQKTNLCRISFVLKVNDFVMLDLTKKPPKICFVPAKDKENL